MRPPHGVFTHLAVDPRVPHGRNHAHMATLPESMGPNKLPGTVRVAGQRSAPKPTANRKAAEERARQPVGQFRVFLEGFLRPFWGGFLSRLFGRPTLFVIPGFARSFDRLRTSPQSRSRSSPRAGHASGVRPTFLRHRSLFAQPNRPRVRRTLIETKSAASRGAAEGEFKNERGRESRSPCRRVRRK